MELTAEVLAAGAVGTLVVLGAIGRYLQSLNRPRPVDPVIAGVGLELGSREQMERLIAAVEKVAAILADKNTAGINDRLDALAETVERLLAERPKPPRRR